MKNPPIILKKILITIALIFISNAFYAQITSANSGNWDNTATWVGGVIPQSTHNVIIASGHVVVLNVTTGGINIRNIGTTTTVDVGGTLAAAVQYINSGSTSINGTFQLNFGGSTTSGNNFSYGASGILNFNTPFIVNNTHQYWPISNGPFNVSVATASNITLSSAPRTVAGTFQTSAAVTLTSSVLTLNGTLQINASGSFVNPPSYGVAATLLYNSGGTFTRGNEWTTATSGPGYPSNVQISNSTTLSMSTTVAQCSANLTIDTGSTLNTTTNVLTVFGNVNINGTISLGGNVATRGNWTVAEAATQTNNDRTVTFNAATGNQIITKTGGGIVSFDRLVISKATSGSVQLNSAIATNVDVNGTSSTVFQISNTGALDLNGQSLSLNNDGGNILASGGTRNVNSTIAGAQFIINGNKINTGGTRVLNFAANVIVVIQKQYSASTANNNTQIRGTLRINPNGAVLTNTIIYVNTSTLEYNGVTGPYLAGFEWGGNGIVAGVGTPQNVLITNNAIVTSPNGARGIAGTFTNNAGSTFSQNASGGDINVYGNWTNNGTFNANDRTVACRGTTARTINGVTTFGTLENRNTSSLTIAATATVGATAYITLFSSSLILGAANRIDDATKIVFSAGGLRTSTSGAGFNETISTISLIANSMITLGTGTHTLTVADSSNETWTVGRILTIIGWIGVPATAGTAGKIMISVGGLTTAQLSQIQFVGYDIGALILPSGELVPDDYFTFYSRTSGAPNLLASWSANRDGTGANPTNFTTAIRKYAIQSGHTMTTTANWTISGSNTLLSIETGGTLVSTFQVAMPTTLSIFEVQNGGTYIHDNTGTYSTTIFAPPTRIFGASSNFIWRRTNTSISNFNNNYGNFTIELAGLAAALNLTNNLRTIQGNLNITNTNNQEIRLSDAGGALTVDGNFTLNGNARFVLKNNNNNNDQIVTVGGNVNLTQGSLGFTNSTTSAGGRGIFIADGENFSLYSIVNMIGFATPVPGSGFYFGYNGIQNITIDQPFTSGNIRDCFYFDNILTRINETYNGNAAQNTVRGGTASILSGYVAWPNNDNIGINNFTVLNPAGVTLRDSKKIANDLIINNNGNLQVPSNFYVDLGGKYDNTSGLATFANNASLVQTTGSSNTNVGNILYQRRTTIMKNFDFTYWSSPVASQTLGGIWMSVNSADTFYSWNGATSAWNRNIAADQMEAGIGYIARARNGGQGTDWNNNTTTFNVASPWEAQFHGVPNSGDVTFLVSGSGANTDNLMGNPYPSAIDIINFRNDIENRDQLTGNFYFWTHNTAIANNAYNPNDYAIFNVVLNASVGAGSGASPAPDRFVDAGQGFFAEGQSTGTVIFKNSHRGNTANNNAFYRTRNGNNAIQNEDDTPILESSKIWLNLTNTEGMFKQQLLTYTEGATVGYDPTLDAKTFNGNSLIDFYSNAASEKFTIQSRAIPFTTTDVVPLGFKTSIAGIYTIAIDRKDGLFDTQTVYLQDNLLNIEHNLNDAPYTFSTAAGTFDNRFIIKYELSMLNVNNSIALAENIIVAKADNSITIKSSNQSINKVLIFDLLGRKVFEQDKINANDFTAKNIILSQQTLIVKIVLEDGMVDTRKLIF